MRIFKKPIQFISVTCPKCSGDLKLDENMERASCPYCGGNYIVQNASRRKKGGLELVLDFVEKRREEKRREEKERKEFLKKWAKWIGIGGFGLLVLIVVLAATGV